jgi:hypothetical protein
MPASGPIPKSNYPAPDWMSDLRKYPSPAISPGIPSGISPAIPSGISSGILYPQGRILPSFNPQERILQWLKRLASLYGGSLWPNPKVRGRDRGHRHAAALEQSYWRMVHDRAVLETAATLHLESRTQLLVKAFVVPVGLVVLAWFGSPDAAKDGLALTVAVAWAIALSLLPLVYLWKLWGLPPRVHQEQLIAHQAKAAALEARFDKKQKHIKFYKQIRDLHSKGQNLLVRSAPADNLMSWSIEVEECLRNASELSELDLFRTIQSSGSMPYTHSMKLAKLRLVLGRAAAKVDNP